MVQQSQTQQQTLYSHAAEPKAVPQRRAKYREDDESGYPSNIMFDKRVVRGNTYAARILPADATTSTLNGDTKKTMSKTKTARQGAPQHSGEAVEGRRHADIQTDLYLEELTDTVPEVDTTTQTDAFLDRPPTPLYVPQKTGLDATTQIENGDLFDFDFEVEPVLEVLVGKVLEQGLMEVLQEEELEAMRAHQEHFEQVRNAELVATQRMEAAEERKIEEKERRMAQERERVERERVVRQKVAASTFARGYLTGIIGTVFDQLTTSGHFFDPVLAEVENGFMPWLKQQACQYLSQGIITRQVVKRLVDDATKQLAASQVSAGLAHAAAENVGTAFAAKEAAAERRSSEAELEAVHARATFILTELEPAVVSPAQVAETRGELESNSVGEASATLELARQAASDASRAELTIKAEEQRIKIAEAQAASLEANPEEEPISVEAILAGATLIDENEIEVAAAAAAAAVEAQPPREVSDGDVLSALIDKGLVTKDAIVQALAIDSIGDGAYTRHPLFLTPEAPPPPPPPPVVAPKPKVPPRK